MFKALQTLGSFQIREQYPIGEKLRIDAVVLEIGIAVEIDGAFHETFTPHFHKDKLGFEASQHRDRVKEELCANAGLTLVRLTYTDINEAKDATSLGNKILSRAQEARAQAKADADEW